MWLLTYFDKFIKYHFYSIRIKSFGAFNSEGYIHIYIVVSSLLYYLLHIYYNEDNVVISGKLFFIYKNLPTLTKMSDYQDKTPYFLSKFPCTCRYENELQAAFSQTNGSDDQVWDFWGSLFYCATIYTTIGQYRGFTWKTCTVLLFCLCLYCMQICVSMLMP